MKVTQDRLRQIIKEEVTKQISEIVGDLTLPYDDETLTKAGLLGPHGKPRPRKPISPFIPWEEVSDEAKQIARELENSEDFRVLVGHGETTSLVQKVLDLLRRKGIGFGE